MLWSWQCFNILPICAYRTVKNFGGKKIWRIESLQSIGGKNLANKDIKRFLQQIIIIINAHALVFVFLQATAYVHVLGKSLISA